MMAVGIADATAHSIGLRSWAAPYILNIEAAYREMKYVLVAETGVLFSSGIIAVRPKAFKLLRKLQSVWVNKYFIINMFLCLKFFFLSVKVCVFKYKSLYLLLKF